MACQVSWTNDKFIGEIIDLLVSYILFMNIIINIYMQILHQYI